MACRRRNACVLLLLVVTTAVSAMLGGPGGVELQLAADLAFAMYLAFLVEARRRRTERATKVRRLDNARSDHRRRVVDDFAFNEPTRVRRRA